jgi:hypothetical protein
MLPLLRNSELTNLPTPWSRVLEKLIVTQSRNSLPFMEPKCSLMCSQEPTTGSYAEPDASTPHLTILFPQDSF